MAASKPILLEPAFIRTFIVVFAVMAAFFVIDTFLARAERAETHAEAARYYDEGRRLMEAGRGAEAVEQFQAALSIVRDNQDYQLAVGQALLAAGKLAEAEDTLNDLLQKDPFSAPANLAMARVLVKEGKIENATSYYHRAIYGQWKENARANEVAVRFELADLLSHQESKEGLLAELLPLADEAGKDVATRMKMGRLFIAAGSPDRAADIFREILRKNPQDADAYAGVGAAEFARGNYRTAQANFLTALRLRPDDQDARKQLDACNQVLQLDPLRRGLNLQEQYGRSQKLVQLVLDNLTQCVGANASESTQELVNASQNALKKHVPSSQWNKALENNLDSAQQLWQARRKECKQPVAAAEEPLALVLAKAAQ